MLENSCNLAAVEEGHEQFFFTLKIAAFSRGRKQQRLIRNGHLK